MQLKCSIGCTSLRSWGRAIHTLAQAETDIHFSFKPDSLILSTMDAANTVFYTYTFNKSFFQRYEADDEAQWTCIVVAKCLLIPFKSLRFLLRCSDACEIEFDCENSTASVSLPCRGGVQILYKLNFTLTTDPLQLDLDEDELINCFVASPKFILKSLSNFAASKGVTDITMKATENKLLLKNSVNDMLKKEGKVYTELTLNSVDFLEYKIEEASELTFPMREFKSFVTFVEFMKASLSLHFKGPNHLVHVKADMEDSPYMATLTMTTVANKSVANEPVTNKSAANKSTANKSTANKSAANKSTANKSAANKSVTNERIANEPIVDEPIVDEPIVNEPIVDERIANEPIVNETIVNEPIVNETIVNEPIDASTLRLRRIFPNLGRPFDPITDIPGYNEILVGCSDEES